MSLPTRNGNKPTPIQFKRAIRIVLSLPTRNGNSCKTSRSGWGGGRFWAYLQGMETSWSKISFFTSLRFEPTYKEWKPPSTGTASRSPLGFEPTYKEWKLNRWRCKMERWMVLSLPTRNGNSIALSAIVHLHICFEPTYKEWKLTYEVYMLIPTLPRFEPTYKEWKLCLPKETELSF